MEKRKLIMVCMVVGGILGGYIPNLWSTDMFSLSGIVFSAVGGFLGIWLGYTFGE